MYFILCVHISYQLLDLSLHIFRLYCFFFHIFRYPDESDITVHTETSKINFEQPVFASEVESEEDLEGKPIPLDLLRLVK